MEYAGIADENSALGIIIITCLDDCVQLGAAVQRAWTGACTSQQLDPQVMPRSSATVAITAVAARPRLL
jgi:hypothetical protein